MTLPPGLDPGISESWLSNKLCQIGRNTGRNTLGGMNAVSANKTSAIHNGLAAHHQKENLPENVPELTLQRGWDSNPRVHSTMD